MDLWTSWKKGFDAWEATTADFLERVMRSPALLQPSGVVLKALSATKEASDTLSAAWWRAFGLPTRRDQERVLHRLNELESLLRDLEERLPGAAPEAPRAAAPRATPEAPADRPRRRSKT